MVLIMNAIQAVKSEYASKHVTLDLLIERYLELSSNASQLRELALGEPFYTLENGTMISHPSMRPWIELEKLLHATLRELGFVARMMDAATPEEADEVDTFLENLERTNRPHRSVNRGDG